MDIFAEDRDVLDLPMPTMDDIEALKESLTTPDVQPAITDAPQTGTPGERVECITCGKTVLVRKDGNLATHKCEARAQRGNRLETLPERRSPIRPRTRQFTVGILSWCIEEGSATILARPFACDSDDVPTELPDADVQIGVPLDLLWPEIPDGARKFLDKLADNADVVDCGIAWFEWGRNISKWAREQRNVQQQLMASRDPVQGGATIHPFVAES